MPALWAMQTFEALPDLRLARVSGGGGERGRGWGGVGMEIWHTPDEA